MFATAVWPVWAELRSIGGGELRLLVRAAVVATLVHVAGLLWAAPRLPVAPDDDVAEDEEQATVLNIGQATV
jgi:hypothetical protein